MLALIDAQFVMVGKSLFARLFNWSTEVGVEPIDPDGEGDDEGCGGDSQCG
jgi:hypothetical protein